MLILAIFCAVFFAAAVDLAVKNKELSNDLMKLSDKVAQKEIELIRAQGLISETRYKIVTLKVNRLIDPEFLQYYGEEVALEETKKMILEEFSKSIKNYTCFHVRERELYQATEVTGILQVLRCEGRKYNDKLQRL